MAPKQLAAADAAQALVVPERDELPEFGPLRQALEELRVGGFASQEEFVLACSRLRAAFEKIGANPDNAKLRRLRRTHPVVASEILAVSGIEEALLDIGWTTDDAGEGALVFHGDASALRAAASQVGEVEAWVRRRDVQLAMAIRDPEGKSSELHHPMVLQGEPKFKGAVWHMSHPSCRPDGVVVFHNSPLSNYSEAGVRLSHEGQEFSFSTSEAIIMAFKQHLLLQTPLKESLGAMTAARSGGEAKAIVARAIRNATECQWWKSHGMHVLVGASACLPKFAQDRGLKQFLLSTQQAVLVEAAPKDGCWGVGDHAGRFLCQSDPADFALHSEAPGYLRFETRDGRRVDRRLCEANALGKALMVVRHVLRRAEDRGEAAPEELSEIIQAVGAQLHRLGVPFDWKAAFHHLVGSEFADGV